MSIEDAISETNAICELVYGDPVNAEARQAIIDAILADARTHGRQVDQNRVRASIPRWVPPRLIGATYNAMRTRNLLVRDGWTTNLDAKGRNVGKPARLYTYTGEL